MLVKFIYGNPFGPFTTLDCYSDFWCSETVKQGDRGGRGWGASVRQLLIR